MNATESKMKGKPVSDYLSPEQVCVLIPGMTKQHLAQLRYKGGGPLFYKPSPRRPVYKREDVVAWIEGSAYERTDRPVAAENK